MVIVPSGPVVKLDAGGGVQNGAPFAGLMQNWLPCSLYPGTTDTGPLSCAYRYSAMNWRFLSGVLYVNTGSIAQSLELPRFTCSAPKVLFSASARDWTDPSMSPELRFSSP